MHLLTFSFDVFAKTAGFAGLCLAVILILFRIILTRIFSVDISDKAYRILLIIIGIITLIFASIFYIQFFSKPERGTVELDSEGKPYEYVSNRSYLSTVDQVIETFDIQKKYRPLPNLVGIVLKNKIIDNDLNTKLVSSIDFAKNEISKIEQRKINKSITSLIYLNGTIIGGSNLYLSLMYEIDPNKKDQVIKYANEAIKGTEKALNLIKNAHHNLSPESSSEFDTWLAEQGHLNRYTFYNFLAKSLLFKYDPKTKIKPEDLHSLFSRVDITYIVSNEFNDTSLFPTMGWLKDQKIIDF